mgnify:CR=1 FL=1
MELQRYKEILQKPEKHLLKTAKDMLRCFFRQLYISAYARTPCLTPGCQTYQDPDVRHTKTRVSDMPRPGCRTCQDPGVMQCPSVSPCFLSAFRCFLSARMRIYYNVSLLPGFPSSLKNMFFNTFVNQRFIKMFKRNAKKSPDIFGVYVIKSYFCTRFREREQRCFDILTGTA